MSLEQVYLTLGTIYFALSLLILLSVVLILIAVAWKIRQFKLKAEHKYGVYLKLIHLVGGSKVIKTGLGLVPLLAIVGKSFGRKK